MSGSRVTVTEALRQQRAWVEHWMGDIAAGLKPTHESLAAALSNIDAALQSQPEAKGWLHRLVAPDGQVEAEVTDSPEQPFGRSGRDFDAAFKVESTPLFP